MREQEIDWDQYEDMEMYPQDYSHHADFTWMPPLQDFVLNDTVYFWVRLADGENGLGIEMCGQSFEEQLQPEWLEHEDDLLYSLMGSNYDPTVESLSCWMELGISPGQPFLIEVPKPRATYSYEGEYDVDYDWQIVRRMPKKPAAAGRAWAKLLERLHFYKSKEEARKYNITQQCLRQPKYWKYSIERFSNRDIDYERISVWLTAELPPSNNNRPTYRHQRRIASGSSERQGFGKGEPKGSEAFAKLVSDFERNHPDIPTSALYKSSNFFETAKKLGVPSLGRWDLLREDLVECREYQP